MIETVKSGLDQPSALGHTGTVIGVGEGVTELNVGDRVVFAGAGYGIYAEFACVPRLLTAKISKENGVRPRLSHPGQHSRKTTLFTPSEREHPERCLELFHRSDQLNLSPHRYSCE